MQEPHAADHSAGRQQLGTEHVSRWAFVEAPDREQRARWNRPITRPQVLLPRPGAALHRRKRALPRVSGLIRNFRTAPGTLTEDPTRS